MIQAIVHQSLVKPIMIMGVPRNIFWSNALITMDLVFLGSWWQLFLSITIHLAVKFICQADPEFFDLLINYYLKADDYLEG